MPDLPQMAWPALIGFAVALLGSVSIALTRRWHGVLTIDTHQGVQKFHDLPTPRIGGLAVFLGFWAATAAIPLPRVYALLVGLGVSGAIVFLSGLAEDLTKRTPIALRLLAGAISSLVFCLVTGYSVNRVEIGLVDGLLTFFPVSLFFTAFSMCVLTHSVNIIDGFNGLAAGAVVIMLAAFGVVAYRAGDHELVLLVSVVASVLSGFLVVNFPRGHLFLGDGGAYFAGLLLGSVAVMLPMRNSDVSPWISIVILAYPVLETLHAIARKSIRHGHHFSRPDRLHLHMLLYRKVARKMRSGLANPVTGVLLWAGPLSSLVFVILIPHDRSWLLLAFLLQATLYAAVYRRVALLRRHRVLQLPKSLSRKH